MGHLYIVKILRFYFDKWINHLPGHVKVKEHADTKKKEETREIYQIMKIYHNTNAMDVKLNILKFNTNYFDVPHME